MTTEHTIRRAQIYGFLAEAFIYPQDDWTTDVPELNRVVRELGMAGLQLDCGVAGLDALQADYRRAIGIAGTMCYETEYGLPHEFRQSQELADIAGFYHAFGFEAGGKVHERPDHLGAELEFTYALALKEAQAITSSMGEQTEVCVEAQRAFLRDHLGKWIGLFAERVAQNPTGSGVYSALAKFTADFVLNDAKQLGVTLEQRQLIAVMPTPFDDDFSCAACPAVELVHEQT
jgi:DMSO reductase family type II enzyme chaperone